MTQHHCQLITNKPDWEAFAANHPQANFLQSYNWGLFQEKIGKKFFAVAVHQDQQPVAAALIIKELAKRGDYFTIAGGPLLDWESSQADQVFGALVAYLRQLAKQEKVHFVRVRPQADDSSRLRQVFKQAGFSPAPIHLTADLTLRLDLSLSEEQLLSLMRKNTRYEVRKAERVGIKTEVSQDPKFMKQFYQHQLYLAKKHQFVPFDFDFLYQQFLAFLEDDQVAFISAYDQDQLLASAFVIFYQDEAVYHYGVSTAANEKLPGSYAVQWRAIQEANKRGCKVYNFWGVSPPENKTHRFAGPSLFKRGFGGEEVQHLPAHDLPTSAAYPLIKGFELMRKKVRGL